MTIKITTYQSMPWRFKIQADGERRTFGRDASDAGEAAAVALQYAAGSKSYVIIGPDKAMQHIPASLRGKGVSWPADNPTPQRAA